MDERTGNILGLLAFLAFLSFLAFLLWQSRQQPSTLTTAEIEKARELLRRLELGQR